MLTNYEASIQFFAEKSYAKGKERSKVWQNNYRKKATEEEKIIEEAFSTAEIQMPQ